ncbi:MAG: glycosyltransferase family 2 protein [Candidatus Lokiarchaeia archaeon]
MEKVTIIIPAYNEVENILNMHENLNKLCNSFEVIVVDDGSTDNTYELLKKTKVTIIRHPYNKGYGASLKTGIRHAQNDIVVFMDADSPHNPNDIYNLLGYMGEYDMVVGERSKASHISLFRKPGKMFLSIIANYLMGTKIPDLNSGFRAAKKEIIEKFMHILPNSFSFSATITLAVIKGGFNVKYVPITTYKRKGKSMVNPIRDGLRSALLIIRIIVLFNPLKVFFPISFLLFMLGVGYLIFSLIFLGFNIPSGVILLIISSIILFFFGILADQISAFRMEGK